MTNQYWLGRGWQIAATPIAQFPVSVENRWGHEATFQSTSYYVGGSPVLSLTNDIFREAIRHVVRNEKPDTVQNLLLDFEFSRAAGLDDFSIIQATSIIETKRNMIMDSTSNRINDLKCGQTDLIKHLTLGFEKVYGRNIQTEEPELFYFLRDLWIARGHIAHGQPVPNSNSIGKPAEPEGDKTGKHLRGILTWMDSILEPTDTE